MRKAATVALARRQMEGDGMEVRRALPNASLRRLDPFLLLDHMGPKEFGPGEGKGAPDHPHRGFETVTYILEGTLQHKDSQGNVGDIGPGDVQWMTAGAGVVHSEMPHPELQKSGGRVQGFQLWVNLPIRDKLMQPRYQDIPATSIPEVAVDGGVVRVIAGRFQEQDAVIDTRTPITYLHAILGPGGRVDLPAPTGHNAFAYVVTGGGTVAGADVQEGTFVGLTDDGDAVAVAAGEAGLSLLLITGKPIGEPVFQWGPFVMTNEAEILQAFQDYQDGKMGTIPVTIG